MKDNNRVNHQIKNKQVRLVESDGSMRGSVDTSFALKRADEEGLDLVEVQPANNGDLSVCKLVDFGKMKYEASKKRKQNTQIGKNQKEIYVSYNISDHDLQIKHKQVRKFLNSRQKVKYTMKLKGRQKQFIDDAIELFKDNLQDFSDIATWESITQNSNNISIILNPSD